MVIYFFFYDDSASIWSGDQVGDDERVFIEQLVARYMSLKNLVWVVAEEYSERYSKLRASNIAQTIADADVHNHVIANHQLSGIVFDHADDTGFDQFALQYNISSVEGLHDGMTSAWQNAAGRYGVMMAESAGHGDDTREVCRRKNWASALGGAQVMILGMDGTSSYNEKMNDCRALIDFFQEADFNTMSPHDELGNNGTWVLADPGRSFISYRREPGNIRLSGLTPGSYTLLWLDTITGTKVNDVVQIESSTTIFEKPASIGSEVALWAKRSSSSPPVPASPANLQVQSLKQ